jgi:hypothetical protein
MIKTTVAVVFAAAVISTSYADDIEADFEIRNLEKNDAPFAQKFFISGDKINMQFFSNDKQGSMIFRGDKSLLWVMNLQKKEYLEINKETIVQLGQSVDLAMAQLKARMSALSPEQRAMVEKMMNGQLDQLQAGPGKANLLSFKKTGVKKTINGYACEQYDVFSGTDKIREMWITGWKNMDDFKDAMTAFDAMEKFFKTMLESLKNSPLANLIDNPYSYTTELNGFPIVSTEIKNNVPVTETVLKSVQRKTLTNDIFVPPADFKANTTMFKQPSSK